MDVQSEQEETNVSGKSVRKNQQDKSRVWIGGAVLMICGAGFVSVAQATTTYVNPVGGSGGSERCLMGVTCVGGSYNNALSIIQVLENDIGSPIIRLDDDFDKIWENTVNFGGQVMARARYASDINKLGYDSGAGYQLLLAAELDKNKKVLVTDKTSYAGDNHTSDFIWDKNLDNNWVQIPVSAGSPFAFILRDKTDNTFWSSNNIGGGIASSGYSNSMNHNDQMVAFKISDDHYIIAWEDTALGSADKDYNDFVAEVMFVMPVPLPAALVLLGSALLGMGALRRRDGGR